MSKKRFLIALMLKTIAFEQVTIQYEVKCSTKALALPYFNQFRCEKFAKVPHFIIENYSCDERYN